MSNYTRTTNFAVKDGLASGNPSKKILGSEFQLEFDNIATSSATKAENDSPTFTGTVTIPTLAATAGSLTSVTSDMTFADNSALNIGTDSDLTVYHDGSNTYVTEQGAGSLFIKSDGAGIVFRNSTGQNYLSLLEASGEAKLFHISGGVSTQRLTSSSSGVVINGACDTDSIILNGITIGATGSEINKLSGMTSSTAELNILTGVTATAAELNILDGVTATTAELNYVDGVTSNVQTQLDAKAPIDSPTFTTDVTVPKISLGSWEIALDGADLVFRNGVTDVFKVTTAGAVIAKDDVTAFGTP